MDNMNIMEEKEDIQTFLDLKEGGPLNIGLAGMSLCGPHYNISRPPQTVTVFEYVEQGHGTLTVDGVEYHPGPGSVYIAPAWRSHSYRSSADDPWIKYWFNLSGPLPDSLRESYGIAEHFLFPDVRTAGELIKSAVHTLKDLPREHILPFMEHRLMQIVRLLAASVQNDPEEQYSTITKQVSGFLRSRLMKPMPELAEIAAAAGRSPAQTIRVFRNETGMTPYHYLLVEKMSAAARLLSDSNKNIREIARMLGFRDEYYFSRVFRQIHGVSPKHYREK